MKRSFVLSFVVLVGLSTVASAVAITNGSFEAQQASVSTTCTAESTITGWNVNGGNLDLCKAGAPYGSIPPDGVIFSFVGGNNDAPNSFLSQSLSGLTIGNSYTVTFFLGGENYISAATEVVQVSMLSGSATPSQNYNAPHSTDDGNGTATHLWDNWSSFNYTFLANATTGEIKWVNVGGTGNDTGIDNVSIADTTVVGGGVPEPSTLVLLSLGLGGLGFLKRRSRRT